MTTYGLENGSSDTCLLRLSSSMAVVLWYAEDEPQCLVTPDPDLTATWPHIAVRWSINHPNVICSSPEDTLLHHLSVFQIVVFLSNNSVQMLSASFGCLLKKDNNRALDKSCFHSNIIFCLHFFLFMMIARDKCSNVSYLLSYALSEGSFAADPDSLIHCCCTHFWKNKWHYIWIDNTQ